MLFRSRRVPRDAPTRNYRDPQHKPELLCALTPFDALCGFRRAADTLALFEALRIRELDPLLAPLRTAPDHEGLRVAFRSIMMMSKEEGAAVVRALVRACETRGTATTTRFSHEYRWAARLDALYPGDVGVVSALMLNLVRLAPGEAIYLGAGNLHAYLGGVGIELMASSDNVLRGGLTRKHVDVPELMRVLDFTSGPVTPLLPEPLASGERAYLTPAKEFRLSVIDLTRGAVERRTVHGPEILLCTEGSAVIAPGDGSPDVTLARGRSAFVPAATERYELRAGENGALYRASVNLT